MTSKLTPSAFLSYVRFVDKHEKGRISEFGERLRGEFELQTGEKLEIFQDRGDIAWGQNWKRRIEESLNEVTFLIPILTPSFFKSEYCRGELERFLRREEELARDDLMLPVYYVRCPVLEDRTQRADDPLAQAVANRQQADWRELRFAENDSVTVQKSFMNLALQIYAALKRPVSDKGPREKQEPTGEQHTGSPQEAAAVVPVTESPSKTVVSEKAGENIRKMLQRKDEMQGRVVEKQSELEEALLSVAAEKKSDWVLVLMPFDDDDMKPILKGITAAAKILGLTTKAVKDVAADVGSVDKIEEMIASSRCIVVDLTHKEPNYHFELGYARGLEKEIIPVMRKGTDIRFTVTGLTCIEYTDSRTLEDDLVKRLNQKALRRT